MTAAERAQILFSALPSNRPDFPILSWSQGGIDFSVYEPYITDGGNGIGFVVEAKDVNGPLPMDNPYQFFNPPIAIVARDVVDETKPIVIIKTMIQDAVVFRARQLGWGG